MAKFLRILGLTLTIIFSLGAIIGAMITMYAAVANRVVEIGTMRALGFRRRSILTAFLIESLILGFIGGYRIVFCLFPATLYRFNTQLPDLFRTCLQFFTDLRNFMQGDAVRFIYGIYRRSTAGSKSFENEYSGGFAGKLIYSVYLSLEGQISKRTHSLCFGFFARQIFLP